MDGWVFILSLCNAHGGQGRVPVGPLNATGDDHALMRGNSAVPLHGGYGQSTQGVHSMSPTPLVQPVARSRGMKGINTGVVSLRETPFSWRIVELAWGGVVALMGEPPQAMPIGGFLGVARKIRMEYVPAEERSGG